MPRYSAFEITYSFSKGCFRCPSHLVLESWDKCISFCSAGLKFLDLFQVEQMTNHPLLLVDNRLSIKPCFCMVTLLWSSRLLRNVHNWKAKKMSTPGCSKADRGEKKRKSFLEKEIESIIQSFKLALQIFTHNIGIPGHDNDLTERGKKKKKIKETST